MKSWRDLHGAPVSRIGNFDGQMLDEVEVHLPSQCGWNFFEWVIAARKRGVIDCQQAVTYVNAALGVK